MRVMDVTKDLKVIGGEKVGTYGKHTVNILTFLLLRAL